MLKRRKIAKTLIKSSKSTSPCENKYIFKAAQVALEIFSSQGDNLFASFIGKEERPKNTCKNSNSMFSGAPKKLNRIFLHLSGTQNIFRNLIFLVDKNKTKKKQLRNSNMNGFNYCIVILYIRKFVIFVSIS